MEDNCDSEDLNSLYERYKLSGTPQQREDLAESYTDIFHEMSYDFSCGKLTEEGVQELVPLLERIEELREKISWDLRAQAYEILMEDAETRNDPTAVIHNGELAIESSLKQLEEDDEMRQMHYVKISYCYYTLLPFIPEEDHSYWKKALLFSKKSILENSEEANWQHYFRLLYGPLQHESLLLSSGRSEERGQFREWCFSLEQNGLLSYVLASAFVGFKEFLNYSASGEVVFPEEEYSFWLERSLAKENIPFVSNKVSGMGHFYKKEGVRLHRIDLLEKALSCFEKLFYDSAEPFAIYYATEVWEALSILYQENGQGEKADACLIKALDWNEDKQDYIEGNFSLLLHYSEFLERCYHYKGTIPKPGLDFILSVSAKAEILGNGYYSGPYLLEARVALARKNEHLAMVSLCKALLLHELCIEERVVEFYKELPKGEYTYIENFIQNTLLFMKEVSDGYYFNPVIKYAALKTMSDSAIVEAWIIRKAEIRKRKRAE